MISIIIQRQLSPREVANYVLNQLPVSFRYQDVPVERFEGFFDRFLDSY